MRSLGSSGVRGVKDKGKGSRVESGESENLGPETKGSDQP